MSRLTTIYFLISALVAYSQNLVKNPSFEEYSECPNALGTFKKHVTSWSTPTGGTTDYFNTCSDVMGAPENFNGVQHPKFGNAYAGLYFYAPLDYREYIQVPLKRMLKKGVTYDLEFYISLAEGSDFAVKDFGILLSYEPVMLRTKKNLSRGQLYKTNSTKHYSIEINHPEFHEDKSDWLKVHTTIKARGYERYLSLGNLRDNASTKKIQTKRRESKRGAYYYIDMVSLHRADGIVDTIESSNFEMDKRYVFEHILFDFDTFKVQESAKPKITKVVEYVKANGVQITIHGHTDDWGTVAYNDALSMQRAEAISAYLIASGISEQAIRLVAHGSKQPLASNETTEGRRKNRRVEFEFTYSKER